MAVAVSSDPSDCDVQVTARTALSAPSIQGTAMYFRGSRMRLNGFATLKGSPGDSTVGWKVGFIQAQWVETNWCSYRGQSNNDGSIFIQRGRAPARTQRACRDCDDSSPIASVFYSVNPQHGETAVGVAGSHFPLVLRVHHSDEPSDACPLTLQNILTGKTNYLREAQFEFLFCTLLSAQEPSGSFRHLIGVYWNTRWQYTFEQPGYRAKVNARGTSADIGMPFRVATSIPASLRS
ncbi:MAG TPA: hypothetical protein VHZ07_11410 [Bryobacteraceae bacterium]|jgi:hypothetical protein|nr:hypothetical protein [Bryobacteraceae bacterium]